jgi:RNA polymerase sigma-70 factor (ECF subfamily)
MSQSRETPTNFSTSRVYVSEDADDLASVRRCLDGDAAAFAPIVERYQRVLFTVALRMLGDEDEAKDAAQNAFVKAYQKLATFDPQRRFFSWIYRILVNDCLNQRRERHPSEPISPELAAADDSPADLFEAKERRKGVQAAIVALPMAYREVVVLRHFAGLSYDDIAEALGVSAAIVKSRLHTARQRLSEMLRDLDARR